MSFFLTGLLSGFIISSALCIYSYRFQKSAKRIEIPSAYLFLNLPQKKIKGAIHFPPRLLLELLFLALIFLTIYQIHEQNNDEKELIILSNSQSMSAKLGDNSADGAKTRFDKAIEMILEQASNSKKYQLITLPQAVEKASVNNEYEDFSAIRTQLKNIRVSSLPDTLPIELNSIISETQANQIRIYTDKVISLDLSDNQKKKIVPYQVGTIKSNTYIDSLTHSKAPDGEEKLEVRIGFSGVGSTKVLAELSILNEGSDSTASVISTREVTIENEQLTNASFELDKKTAKNTKYKIFLKNILQFDAIESDNEAYFVKDETASSQTIYLISAERDLDLIVTSLKNASLAKVEVLSPEDVDKQTFEKNSLLIYYKSKLPGVFKAPSLVILPNADSPYLKFSSIAKRMSLTSWDKLSPITRYISFETLSIPQAIVFSDTNWGSGIIFNQQGPILMAGVVNSYKVIISGFELLPFDKERKSASDILLLNILGELKDTQDEVKLNQQLSSSFESPTCITQKYNCNIKLKYLEKGIYNIKNKDHKKTIAVNNLSASESKTNIPANLFVKLQSNALDQNIVDTNNQTPWTLWLAILVLLIDLVLLNIKGEELNWKVS